MDHERELDAIGRILASEEALVPSSGFVSAVMERVRQESAAPVPIPFPWKRAIPGMALAAGVFGWGAVEMVRYASTMTMSLGPLHLSAATTSGLESGGWAALALAASLLAWRISYRLFGRSGLL